MAARESEQAENRDTVEQHGFWAVAGLAGPTARFSERVLFPAIPGASAKTQTFLSRGSCAHR